MENIYILYNPLANNGRGEAGAQKAVQNYAGKNTVLIDITKTDISAFLADKTETDTAVIVGGDGTLNRLANQMDAGSLSCSLFYYPAGSGNDFMADLGKNGIIDLKPYLQNLPEVTVKGKTSRFLNGIGYGIDGYCCEVGDRLRAKSVEKINYTSIAIKGLLFHFKPADAAVTVDGVKHTYKSVWIAPTMNGRFYGGGMMVTPAQDRLNKERTLSVCVYHNPSRLKALMLFPSIFKGEHIRHKDTVEIFTGHNIKVEFSRPCALQIDGETVLDVTSYEAHSPQIL